MILRPEKKHLFTDDISTNDFALGTDLVQCTSRICSCWDAYYAIPQEHNKLYAYECGTSSFSLGHTLYCSHTRLAKTCPKSKKQTNKQTRIHIKQIINMLLTLHVIMTIVIMII